MHYYPGAGDDEPPEHMKALRSVPADAGGMRIELKGQTQMYFTTWETLKELRAAMRIYIADALGKHHSFTEPEIGERILHDHRDLVVQTLGRLATQHAGDYNVSRNPDLEELAATLDLPYRLVEQQNVNVARKLFGIAAFLTTTLGEYHRRMADLLREEQQRLEPVMNGHPEMTVGEAQSLLKEQTDRTLIDLGS